MQMSTVNGEITVKEILRTGRQSRRQDNFREASSFAGAEYWAAGCSFIFHYFMARRGATLFHPLSDRQASGVIDPLSRICIQGLKLNFPSSSIGP